MSDDGCITYAASPGIPATPAQVISRADFGWDAGANSVDRLSGDLHLVFTMPSPVVGAVNGLRSDRPGVGIPDLVQFGFMFGKAAPTGDVYAVFENGAPIGGYVVRSTLLDEEFEIRRVRDTVTYRVNGVVVHTSTQKTFAPLLTTGCLFASGDSIA